MDKVFAFIRHSRGLAGAIAYAIFAFTTLGIIYLGIFFWPNGEPYAPLEGYNIPQPIASDIVPEGGVLVVTEAIKCNGSDEPISVVGEAHWRRIDNGGQEVVPYRSSSFSFHPGCTTRTFDNRLSEGVGPGLWILEGTDSTFRGDERQDVTWSTDPFRVFPKSCFPEVVRLCPE